MISFELLTTTLQLRELKSVWLIALGGGNPLERHTTTTKETVMRLPQYITAAILLSFSLSSHALLVGMFSGTASGSSQTGTEVTPFSDVPFTFEFKGTPVTNPGGINQSDWSFSLDGVAQETFRLLNLRQFGNRLLVEQSIEIGAEGFLTVELDIADMFNPAPVTGRIDQIFVTLPNGVKTGNRLQVDFELTQGSIQQVTEPGMLALLGFGVLGLLRRANRKHHYSHP